LRPAYGAKCVCATVGETSVRICADGGRQAMKSCPRTVLRPFAFARFAACPSTQYMYPFSASKASPTMLQPAFLSTPFALLAIIDSRLTPSSSRMSIRPIYAESGTAILSYDGVNQRPLVQIRETDEEPSFRVLLRLWSHHATPPF
jgi:hypothetical protein